MRTQQKNEIFGEGLRFHQFSLVKRGDEDEDETIIDWPDESSSDEAA